jgi:hypothetical protein
MTPTEKITNRLLTHRDALLNLGDEFGEAGNQYVTSAGKWLRPVINDFIETVQDRYDSIATYAETNTTINPEIVRAADEFFDDAVETILKIYPMPVRSKVRGITSQIRNELAILRIDTKAVVDEKAAKQKTESVDHDADWKNKIIAINNDPAEFKKFLQNEKFYSNAAAHIIFNNIALANQDTAPDFNKLAMQCAKEKTEATATPQSKETAANSFTTFRQYWLSLPAGNLLLAMAINKMLADQSLLEHFIRHRNDVKELLLNCLPTVESRKQAIQFILASDYMDPRSIARLFDLLPEGNKVNSRVDAALYGIKKYLQQSPDLSAVHIEWDNSKQKIRAETYLKILEHYNNANPFMKKIIVYALLQSEGKKLQQTVYRIMGYTQLDMAKKNFRDSIRFDAERMKIDFNQLNEEVIHTIIKNTNAKKTYESGAYKPVLDQLKKLIPSSQEIT